MAYYTLNYCTLQLYLVRRKDVFPTRLDKAESHVPCVRFPRGKIKYARYERDRGTKKESDKKANLPAFR